MPKISAHDPNNGFATGPTGTIAGTGTAWAHGFTSQANVTAAIVKSTGGTYSAGKPEALEEVEEVAEEESAKPRRATKKK